MKAATRDKRKARKKTSTIQPLDRRCALRVKIKSLALEAMVIRKEEQRTSSWNQYNYLRMHRVNEVRTAAREALLALAIVRGKTYETVEQKATTLETKQIQRIAQMVRTYGCKPTYTGDDVRAWLVAGKEVLTKAA
jgi:hypothetical protein